MVLNYLFNIVQLQSGQVMVACKFNLRLKPELRFTV